MHQQNFIFLFVATLVLGEAFLGNPTVGRAEDRTAVNPAGEIKADGDAAIKVKVIRSDDLKTTYGGKPARASLIEISFAALASIPPHRHPGPVVGYVLEGTLEFQIGDQPLRTFHQGDTFFEPSMILHRVARNPDKREPCRILVTMIHPADAKRLTIPEPVAGTVTPKSVSQ